MPLFDQEQFDKNMAKLPKFCYAQRPDSPCHVALLKKGEVGYWPSQYGDKPFANPEDAKRFLDKRNEALRVTAPQREAMLNGSIFGFDNMGADPDNTINITSANFKEKA